MGQRLGQHFLKNAKAISKIVDLVEPKKNELIIEIGPGRGQLTKPLLRKCAGVGAKLVVVERDGELAKNLSGVEVEVGDVLRLLPDLVLKHSKEDVGYWVVGNIPYYITGKLLRLLEGLSPRPKQMVLMVQKEVAERVSARPDKMNLLAAAVQIWADVEVAFTLCAEEFSPPPKVDSAVVVLKTKRLEPTNLTKYYQCLKILFASPRKTIENNLIAGTLLKREEVESGLKKLKIKLGQRPQNLTTAKIAALAELLI